MQEQSHYHGRPPRDPVPPPAAYGPHYGPHVIDQSHAANEEHRRRVLVAGAGAVLFFVGIVAAALYVVAQRERPSGDNFTGWPAPESPGVTGSIKAAVADIPAGVFFPIVVLLCALGAYFLYPLVRFAVSAFRGRFMRGVGTYGMEVPDTDVNASQVRVYVGDVHRDFGELMNDLKNKTDFRDTKKPAQERYDALLQRMENYANVQLPQIAGGSSEKSREATARLRELAAAMKGFAQLHARLKMHDDLKKIVAAIDGLPDDGKADEKTTDKALSDLSDAMKGTMFAKLGEAVLKLRGGRPQKRILRAFKGIPTDAEVAEGYAELLRIRNACRGAAGTGRSPSEAFLAEFAMSGKVFRRITADIERRIDAMQQAIWRFYYATYLTVKITSP